MAACPQVHYRGLSDFFDRITTEAMLAGELGDIRAVLPAELRVILG